MASKGFSSEVEAAGLGLATVRLAKVRGESGALHTFSFAARARSTTFALDVYDEVRDIDVLKTYVKVYDTKAVGAMVCVTGRVSKRAEAMAKDYGMNIIAPAEVPRYLRSLALGNKAAYDHFPVLNAASSR